MRIGNREVGDGPPHLIAEISGNHCGDLARAYGLIEAAAWIKADAVKLQYYSPGDLTIDSDNPDFIIKDGPWKGKRLYELYTTTHTPSWWFPPLFDKAKELGIAAFASVFSMEAVDELEKLGCPAYKIASMEITDTALIGYASATKKPLIISTGMASEDEILQAGYACGENYDVAFLHCVSGYPTPIEESNLLEMRDLINHSDVYGLSDHTLGTTVPIAATALGASIIEKHLCLSRSDPTEDAAFSMEPTEFQNMIEVVGATWRACQLSKAKSEESSRQLRRSLYVTQDMQRGDMFTIENVRSIRPGYGLPPSQLEKVICRRANQDIKRGTALTKSLMK